MSEHLCTKDHAALSASVLAMAHYVCEWADDATLFALMAALAQHAAQVAARLDQQHSMGPPPSDMSQYAVATPRNAGRVARTNGPG